MIGLIVLGVLIVLLLILAASCIKIVPQAHAMVIERLGMYLATWEQVSILRFLLLTGSQGR